MPKLIKSIAGSPLEMIKITNLAISEQQIKWVMHTYFFNVWYDKFNVFENLIKSITLCGTFDN